MLRGTARRRIVQAIANKLEEINGTGKWTVDIAGRISTTLKFWDEVDTFPFVCVVAGDEVRDRQTVDFSWGFLNIGIKVYVQDARDAQLELEQIMENIEQLLAYDELDLSYGDLPEEMICDSELLRIVTDEGVLQYHDGIGVGEMTFRIRYQVV